MRCICIGIRCHWTEAENNAAITSRFLVTLSTVTSDWSPIVGVGVAVLSRASLVVWSEAGDGQAEERPDTAGLDVNLSVGVGLLMEFCRLSVMPRGGPPTCRLWRRLTESPEVGVTCSVASAPSWLFSGGSLQTQDKQTNKRERIKCLKWQSHCEGTTRVEVTGRTAWKGDSSSGYSRQTAMERRWHDAADCSK